MKPVYVTGSEEKAKLFNECLGFDLTHEYADVHEIQSLDIEEVVSFKAKEAFKMLQKPVIVEDTKFIICALGRFPGPLIKWILQEVGCEGIIKIVDAFGDRSAIAGSAIAYFDGKNMKIFERELEGTIAERPKGDGGWGFDKIFIADGNNKTQAELDEATYKEFYKKIKPFNDLSNFLKSLETSQT